MKLVCIRCPRGCEININGENIEGDSCPRGLEYAKEEMTRPMRMVTALLHTTDDGVVSVKTSGNVPKTEINKVLKVISKTHVKNAHIGDIIISNILDLGVDIIVTGESYKTKN